MTCIRPLSRFEPSANQDYLRDLRFGPNQVAISYPPMTPSQFTIDSIAYIIFFCTHSFLSISSEIQRNKFRHPQVATRVISPQCTVRWTLPAPKEAVGIPSIYWNITSHCKYECKGHEYTERIQPTEQVIPSHFPTPFSCQLPRSSQRQPATDFPSSSSLISGL